ncbi:MAG: sugar phosphate isomerase/epimerase [Candidatus Omnitrophica bacterium]|nr:sugar phosphate isomerase/epimerase [Candidatus Omnitrophota bacterium]
MKNVSLSTVWNASLVRDAQTLVAQVHVAGFSRVELGFSLSESMVRDIAVLCDQGHISVSSVHNFCPVPSGYAPERFFPDTFSLASTNAQERAMAVTLTKKSVETAQRVGARALVVHAGRVEIASRMKELVLLVDQGGSGSPRYQTILSEMRQMRDEQKGPHLEAVVRSLEELLPSAQQADVTLCLETRYYFREIPCLEEFDMIFKALGNPPGLGYWHDVGHAQTAENLGIYSHDEILSRYGGKMLGMHLHDVVGGHDHQVPGRGRFDFRRILPWLKKDAVIKVLEVHPPASAAELQGAAEFLDNLSE